jgi:hypothetical protein
MEFVIIWVIAAAIGLLISYSIIRAAVRAALMDHYEAVQRMTAPKDEIADSAPSAPLKWWQR